MGDMADNWEKSEEWRKFPLGTSVHELEGKLIACHPNYDPVIIESGNNTPHQSPSERPDSTNDKPGIVGQGGKS